MDTAGAQQIENGVNRLTHIGLARTTAGFGRRNQRLQMRPFALRHVAGVTSTGPRVSLALLLGPHPESPSDALKI